MDRPIKAFDDFLLYYYAMSDGESRVVPVEGITKQQSLPAEVEAEYRARFGELFDKRYFLPLRSIGAMLKGRLYGVETGKTLQPGRDLGHAVILQSPISELTQVAQGDSIYVCLVPRDGTYYRRRMYHNFSGLPDLPGYHEPVSQVHVPRHEEDQFIFVATGLAAVAGGGTFGPLSLLRVVAGKGERSIALAMPGTSIVHIWKD